MGEYKRLVSYLYEDKDSEKGKNAGFVRVEVRGPLVSFRIGLTERQGVGQALLLTAGGEMVELGRIGTGDDAREKLTAERENMGGSGLSWEEFSGLRLEFSESGRNYQAFWDSRVSSATRFRRRGDVVLEKEIMPEPVADDLQNRTMPEPMAVNEESVIPEMEEKSSMEEWGTEKGKEEKQETVVSGVSEEMPETTENIKEEIPAELAEETCAQSISYTEAWREEPRITWPQLQKIYPAMLPFGKDDTWQVLRIHLQDIGRLPREYWLLGNNEFVVHGYETHHHLLLIHDPGGDITYLGVPGEELPQERRVAELFGFRRYRRAEPVGYWLTRIKL